MSLVLDAYAARLPEIGLPARIGFLVIDVIGQRLLAHSSAHSDHTHGMGLREGEQLGAYDGEDSSEFTHHPHHDHGGGEHPLGPRAPLCVALAIDASSSMRGTRFALALQAARDLIDTLNPADRVAIVAFDRSSKLVLDPVAIDADGRVGAHRALDRLATGLGTNISAGWNECAEALSRLFVPGAERRILLLTDGLPSQGEREPSALKKIIADGRNRGIETSVIGIGDAIDENLCSSMARAGEGRFHYLRNDGLLGDVIANEIDGARRLAATDVSVVLALTTRVRRAEVLHRFVCVPDGRTLEVRVGAVSYGVPRSMLLQVEVDNPGVDAVLGAAVARGKYTFAQRAEMTMGGYALGARSAQEDDGREAASDRVSLSLAAGLGGEEARKRVALEVLKLRTVAEIRSAWDGFDARDYDAVARRLGRARDLRKVLNEAGLLETGSLADVPDVNAIEAAMLGRGSDMREARRTFTSWAHNTQSSQIVPFPRKKD